MVSALPLTFTISIIFFFAGPTDGTIPFSSIDRPEPILIPPRTVADAIGRGIRRAYCDPCRTVMDV